jgi:hypothetical protein
MGGLSCWGAINCKKRDGGGLGSLAYDALSFRRRLGCTAADLLAVDSSSVFRVARFRVFDFGVTSSSMLLTPPIAISASLPRPHERVGTS